MHGIQRPHLHHDHNLKSVCRYNKKNRRIGYFVTFLKAKNKEPDLSKEDIVTEIGSSDCSNEMVDVPFNGLIGQENGQIFEKPMEKFDAAYAPTRSTEGMPGLPGSDERNEAIMNRIKERVADLKTKDEWRNDQENFGRNPLSNVAITEVMLEQLKVIRPIESFSEFTLTLCLLIFTTAFLTVFVDFNNYLDDHFIEWWTEFDTISS